MARVPGRSRNSRRGRMSPTATARPITRDQPCPQAAEPSAPRRGPVVAGSTDRACGGNIRHRRGDEPPDSRCDQQHQGSGTSLPSLRSPTNGEVGKTISRSQVKQGARQRRRGCQEADVCEDPRLGAGARLLQPATPTDAAITATMGQLSDAWSRNENAAPPALAMATTNTTRRRTTSTSVASTPEDAERDQHDRGNRSTQHRG